jgi:D-alanyl-lipoteichoic acid acyltransferase DltB (MBOAT superfamily)
MVLTFSLVVFAWIFFRANNLTHAISYIKTIFSKSTFSVPQMDVSGFEILNTILLIIGFLIIEWNGRENQYAIATLGIFKKRSYRLAFYFTLILTIYLFMGREQQFIYFQF